MASFKFHLDRRGMAVLGRRKETIVVVVRYRDLDRRGVGDVKLPSFDKAIVEGVQGLP